MNRAIRIRRNGDVSISDVDELSLMVAVETLGASLATGELTTGIPHERVAQLVATAREVVTTLDAILSASENSRAARAGDPDEVRASTTGDAVEVNVSLR